MSNVERFGIFGGTFDPPHNGHIHAALAFCKEMSLDKLLIMPTCIPPHKKVAHPDNPEIRLKMVHAAFDGISEKIDVSDYEITKSGVSYTIDTLEHFSAKGRVIYLLCGTDMFLSLDTWRRHDRIFELAEIVCVPRDDLSFDKLKAKADYYKSSSNAKCHILQALPLEISSTELRNQIANGNIANEYIPEGVRTIIEREKLYK